MFIFLAFLGIIALFIFFIIGLYNSLVTLRNRYKNAFSQIDVQLKRRYDLIPNLVETTKKYLSHERETLEAVIAARNQAYNANQQAGINPGDPKLMRELAGAEQALTGAMGRLMAVAESYPQLKADSTIAQLMEELTSTENKIAFARQAFNDSVTEYNTATETFPSVIIAGMFNFQKAELFEITAAQEREAVKVQF